MPARVLVVDDSVVIRKILTTTLSSVGDVEVAGTAALGSIALSKIPQLNPDVVILDVEMPEMDGLETLRRIRAQWPRLPVIMFSTKTERGAVATIEALTLGASDYVAKPSNIGNVVVAMQRVRDELAPKIRALTSRGAPPPAPIVRPSAPLPVVTRLAPPRAPVSLIAIGSSTGGPSALATVLSGLPGKLRVPIVIVQHMLPTFTAHFAARLATQTKLEVVEASNGDRLAPGRVYLARGDYHMRVSRERISLDQGTPENFCRPAVDVLFRSAAESFGSGVLGVVLTGMGQDGLSGAGHIQSAGGNVIVQDEATSVVWGMPGFVSRAGLANGAFPVDAIASELMRRLAPMAVRA